MKYLVKLNFAVFFIFGFSMQTAIAQTQITHQIISNGGATMSNGSYRLTGTVGQPAVGTGSSADHTLSAGFWAQAGVVVTSVEEIEQNTLPETFRLEQNYPNPFNPTTTIQFALPGRSHVSLKLFDLLGREVATLVDEEMAAGEYKLQFEAAHLPSGVYFYMMKANHFMASKKLTLLK
ncbi:T9SS type A sorting domain-containing protein [candidate division KSB1 bacterium]|nr:T9SS type A sorting domain-containing protein [candidate division KSB1 bacterium]